MTEAACHPSTFPSGRFHLSLQRHRPRPFLQPRTSVRSNSLLCRYLASILQFSHPLKTPVTSIPLPFPSSPTLVDYLPTRKPRVRTFHCLQPVCLLCPRFIPTNIKKLLHFPHFKQALGFDLLHSFSSTAPHLSAYPLLLELSQLASSPNHSPLYPSTYLMLSPRRYRSCSGASPSESCLVSGATAAFPLSRFAPARWTKLRAPPSRENALSPLSLAQPALIPSTTAISPPESGGAPLLAAPPEADLSIALPLPTKVAGQEPSRKVVRTTTPPP